MIRLFNAYFPTRTLLLTVTEAALVTLGFVLAVEFWAGTASDASIYLLYENGLGRIGLVVAVFLILMYYFDLYDSFVFVEPAGGGDPAGGRTGLRLRRVGGAVLRVSRGQPGGQHVMGRRRYRRHRGSCLAQAFLCA